MVIFTVSLPGYGCDEHFIIRNGSVTITNIIHIPPFHIKAHITCREGFVRFGPGVLVCVLNVNTGSHWDQQYPVCRSKLSYKGGHIQQRAGTLVLRNKPKPHSYVIAVIADQH